VNNHKAQEIHRESLGLQ